MSPQATVAPAHHLSELTLCLPHAWPCRRKKEGREFCYNNLETAEHLFFECKVTREVWIAVAPKIGYNQITNDLQTVVNLTDWWDRCALQPTKDQAKGYQSVQILVAWELRMERNRRVFRGESYRSIRLPVGSGTKSAPGPYVELVTLRESQIKQCGGAAESAQSEVLVL
uniref:Reverse transcriptase zinc-binding domain-containing protein n=1 Tax=Oryza brachyantha TaxID=4533 RepID=J3LFV1_ORYBR